MKKQDQIFTTKAHEGKERVYAFISIFSGEHLTVTLLAHSWGKINGVQFFDTNDEQHIELHGDFKFIIHIPSQGATFDVNGKQRELKDAESLIIQ